MKKTEIAMTILVASVAMVGAFFLARALFGSEIEREAIVETTEPIIVDGSKGVSISRRIFNEEALNPTVEVYVDSGTDSSGMLLMDDLQALIGTLEEENN